MPAEIKVQSPAAPFTAAPASIKGLPPLRKIPGKTRLVKDLVRVGRWNVALTPDDQPIFEDFTPEKLQQLAARFSEHKRAGIGHPICFDHGRVSAGGDTAERDSIADIDEMWTDGTTLWIATYVTPSQKATLTDKVRRVSLGAVWDWIDGTGKAWPGPSIIHCAVVAHPVVSPQYPFLEMSLTQKAKVASRMKPLTLAHRAAARKLRQHLNPRVRPLTMSATFEGGSAKIDFEKMVRNINRLLEAVQPGSSMPLTGPHAVTPENFDDVFTAVVRVVCGPDDSEETPQDQWDSVIDKQPRFRDVPEPRLMGLKGRTMRRPPGEPTLADKNAARRLMGLPPKTK